MGDEAPFATLCAEVAGDLLSELSVEQPVSGLYRLQNTGTKSDWPAG